MAKDLFSDFPSIGLDDASLPLGSDIAESLLRLNTPEANQNTHVEVPLLITPNGRGLYEKPSFSAALYINYVH